jgi:hypothetical protein
MDGQIQVETWSLPKKEFISYPAAKYESGKIYGTFWRYAVPNRVDSGCIRAVESA